MSLLQAIANGLRDIQATRYSELASSSIIIYDHLITLGDEIDLIWRSPWSVGKAIFFVNRYYTLAAVILDNYGLFGSNLNDSFCHRFFQWQGWTGLIASMLAEVILQMRLYALWCLDKRILTIMVSSFVLSSAASATIMGMVLSKITATSHPIPGGPPFCYIPNVPPYFFAFWIPIIMFESLLCFLALYRGFQTYFSHRPIFRSGKHLVGILVRDSVLYYIVMFATYLTNLIIWSAAPSDLLEIPIGFSVAMSCVLCNRIVLNVRRARLELENTTPGLSSKVTNIMSVTTGVHVSSADFVPASPSSAGGLLTAIEMDELRQLRADTTSLGHGQYVVI